MSWWFVVRDTPVLIPNTEVKTYRGDGTRNGRVAHRQLTGFNYLDKGAKNISKIALKLGLFWMLRISYLTKQVSGCIMKKDSQTTLNRGDQVVFNSYLVTRSVFPSLPDMRAAVALIHEEYGYGHVSAIAPGNIGLIVFTDQPISELDRKALEVVIWE